MVDQNSQSDDSFFPLSCYNNYSGVAAGFTGNGCKITQAKFKMDAYSPYNDFRAEIYAYDGVWGSGSLGALLAVSDPTVDGVFVFYSQFSKIDNNSALVSPGGFMLVTSHVLSNKRLLRDSNDATLCDIEVKSIT